MYAGEFPVSVSVLSPMLEVWIAGKELPKKFDVFLWSVIKSAGGNDFFGFFWIQIEVPCSSPVVFCPLLNPVKIATCVSCS